MVKHSNQLKILDFALHIGCACIVLITIFFTLGLHIEQTIIQSEIDSAVNQVHFFVETVVSNDQQQIINQKIQDLQVDSQLYPEDKSINENNKKIKKQSLFAIFVISTLLAVLIFYNVHKQNISLKEAVKTILKYVVPIFVVEITFLLFVVKRYHTIDSNFIKTAILKSLEK